MQQAGAVFTFYTKIDNMSEPIGILRNFNNQNSYLIFVFFIFMGKFAPKGFMYLGYNPPTMG